MPPTAERLPQTEPFLDVEQRHRTDTVTWLAENLHGSMRSSFEFSFDGQELYGQDGGSLTAVFDNAVEAARAIASVNPGQIFELRRRLIERGELDDIMAMARGELYTDDGEPADTIVVCSDFPPELMSAKHDTLGYNISRQQTMLRVITREADGTIRMTSQSLDHSDRQGLEAVYGSLGKQAETGELLPQRVALKLPAAWRDNLINNLTETYDSSLSERYGGDWHAGIRQQGDRRIINTYAFAQAQRDLVDWFTWQKLADPVAAERLRYNLAAATTARYERYVKQALSYPSPEVGSGTYRHEHFISVAAIAAGQDLLNELEREGRRAALRGETYSGCGISLSANGEATAEQLSDLGYRGGSGKSKSEKDVMHCVNCPKCRTYHEEIRAKNGIFRCENRDCGYMALATAV